MKNLPDGLYDLLVTQAIEHEIARLAKNRRADTEPLEPADSYLLLGRHIAAVIRNALDGIKDEHRVSSRRRSPMRPSVPLRHRCRNTSPATTSSPSPRSGSPRSIPSTL